MFEKWLKERGINPDTIDAATKAVLRGIYDREQTALEDARKQQTAANPPAAPPAGDSRAANDEQLAARYDVITAAAESATATAEAAVRADLLAYANTLVRDRSIPVTDAVVRLGKKVAELATGGTGTPTPPAQNPGQRELSALPRDPEAILSRQEIVSVFGEEREDRSVYRHAGESVVRHFEKGDDMGLRGLIKDLEGKKGLLRVHVEQGGAPVVRLVSSSSANVAIQVVLTTLLNKKYDERPPVTDPMVTIIPSSASEETLPEVEAENGVKKVKEGEPYPIMGDSARTVKTGYHKWGGAVAQTRENSIFDKLGRVSVLLTSLARQLRAKRDQFRLARICDYSTFDGRYIARPGNDEGSAAFYSGTADHRGNANLVTSNGLSDYTDIEAVNLALKSMKLLDGTYVLPELSTVLVDATKEATAFKILNSIYCPPTGTDTANPMQVNPYGPNGMLRQLPTIISHPLVATYAGAATTWFAGDPAQQFYEKEVWGVEVAPKMTDGEMALRDIVGLWIGSFCVDMVALSNMFFVKNTA